MARNYEIRLARKFEIRGILRLFLVPINRVSQGPPKFIYYFIIINSLFTVCTHIMININHDNLKIVPISWSFKEWMMPLFWYALYVERFLPATVYYGHLLAHSLPVATPLKATLHQAQILNVLLHQMNNSENVFVLPDLILNEFLAFIGPKGKKNKLFLLKCDVIVRFRISYVVLIPKNVPCKPKSIQIPVSHNHMPFVALISNVISSI